MHHADLDGDDADRVTVGSALRNRAVTDDAAAADAVDHVDRLADLLFEQRPDDARGGVGAAPAAQGTINVTGRSG